MSSDYEVLKEIQLQGGSVNSIKAIKDDLLLVKTCEYLILLDISNIENPQYHYIH